MIFLWSFLEFLPLLNLKDFFKIGAAFKRQRNLEKKIFEIQHFQKPEPQSNPITLLFSASPFSENQIWKAFLIYLAYALKC